MDLNVPVIIATFTYILYPHLQHFLLSLTWNCIQVMII